MFAAAVGLLASPIAARQTKPIQPLGLSLAEPKQITGVDLSFEPSFATELSESDAKAARKRAAAGLEPLDPNSYPTGSSTAGGYETLPFKQMFSLVLRDSARQWGLTNGRRIKLAIALSTLRTADAAMAVLIGSSDQLRGTVSVINADNGASLGSFQVNVVNTHGGLGGLALRGNGVRESMTEEFCLEVNRYLTGQKRPRAKN